MNKKQLEQIFTSKERGKNMTIEQYIKDTFCNKYYFLEEAEYKNTNACVIFFTLIYPKIFLINILKELQNTFKENSDKINKRLLKNRIRNIKQAINIYENKMITEMRKEYTKTKKLKLDVTYKGSPYLEGRGIKKGSNIMFPSFNFNLHVTEITY